MCEKFEIGKNYKNYKVLSIFDISDYHSKAIYLRHEITGLEVVHLKNDDTENLFAFAFRTPNTKANGAAHIIEHSVLCGSEKFPLKDPFLVLSNQSLKTYLNAMTYPDKTVYPASSISKTDYFNLMNVYGDAVFFPLLEKEIFMQEAHRLEIDDDGKPSVQGVVYNEMKGDYSSFDSVAENYSIQNLFKGSVYEKDSGGNPSEIPSITYEEFKDFHKKWYRPDNCLLFLFGDIPTETQLDFIEEKFLGRLEKKFPLCNGAEENRKKNVEDFLRLVTPEKRQNPDEFYCEGPSGDDESESTVLVNWNLGSCKNADDLIEKFALSGILSNHDGSPLQKALIESGLGEDTAPQSGLSTSHYNVSFTSGLRGVKKGDEKKVEKLIFDTFERLVKEGVSKSDIDGTLISMEFSHREIKRGHGPFSLNLMNRIVCGWVYDYGVENQILSKANIDGFKLKIKNDPAYIEKLIQKNFLENSQRVFVVVTPTKEYNEKVESAEKELVEKLMEKVSVEKLKLELEEFHKFQKKKDDSSCLPHLNPMDFFENGEPIMGKSNLKIESIKGADNGDVPFLKSYQNTNGIVYMSVGFPVDVLPVETYDILPLFSGIVTEIGWKNLDWAKSAEETALHTGGIGAALLTMDGPDTENSRNIRKKYNWVGRDWIIFRMSMLEEEIENALQLLSDCICSPCFDDCNRIEDLLTEAKNDFESSVIPSGYIFVSNRALRKSSEKSAIDELWNGFSQLFALRKYVDMDVKNISERFKKIWNTVRNSGGFIHLTAEKSGMEKVSDLLPKFIGEVNLVSPKNKIGNKAEDFINAAEISGEGENSDNEIFIANSQVGYAGSRVEASCYEENLSAVEEVCAHWLTNNLLWEELRTVGGAYGAFCNTEPCSGSLIFASYRDPTPEKSSDTFEKCVKKASEMVLTDEAVEKAVIGTYSKFVQPKTPRMQGSLELTRALYGIVDDDRKEKFSKILRTTSSEVKSAFENLAKKIDSDDKSSKNLRAMITGDKTLKDGKNSKIISLGL